MAMFEIEHYLTANAGVDLYIGWLRRLRDNHAKVAIIRRVSRIEQGNFGDHKFCRDGVWEQAVSYWQDWSRRRHHEKQTP